MNKTKMAGIALIGLGTIEHTAGRLLRNRRMQANGFARQISGQSKLAIGAAMLRVGGRLQAVRPQRQESIKN